MPLLRWRLPSSVLAILLLVLAFLALPGAASAAEAGNRLILLGPPGAGKSTTGRQLQERLGIPHISVGDLFREEAQSGSELGKQLRGFMSRGDLVPDEIVFATLLERLAAPDAARGFILDGFPRTIAQAQTLEEHLRGVGQGITAVICLRVSFRELSARLAARGRADDTEEAIRRRHLLFLSESGPIERFYRAQGLLHRIEGDDRTPEQVLAEVLKVLRP